MKVEILRIRAKSRATDGAVASPSLQRGLENTWKKCLGGHPRYFGRTLHLQHSQGLTPSIALPSHPHSTSLKHVFLLPFPPPQPITPITSPSTPPPSPTTPSGPKYHHVTTGIATARGPIDEQDTNASHRPRRNQCIYISGQGGGVGGGKMAGEGKEVGRRNIIMIMILGID